MSENEVVVENEEVLSIDSILAEDEVAKSSTEEILVEEVSETDIKKTNENSFTTGLLVGIVDQIVVLAGALVIYLVFSLILKVCGYYIVGKETIFLIIYAISNILYVPVCTKLKVKTTIGKKIVLKK